jgi:hypothetical protein
MSLPGYLRRYQKSNDTQLSNEGPYGQPPGN